MRPLIPLLASTLLMATGITALASSFSFSKPEGTYNVESSWNEKTEEFVSKISFIPDSKNECKSFGFIQAKKQEDLNNNDYIWTKKSGLSKLNFLKTKDNWFVNHSPNRCPKGVDCSPFVDDWSPVKDTNGISMTEQESEDNLIGRIEAESCLVCKDTFDVLSCVQYTQVFKPKKEVKPAIIDKPSSFFTETLSLFLQYYKK